MKNIFEKKKLSVRKSLGLIIKDARKKKEVSLQQAEMDTKIRIKYLIALEKDDYSNMPADVYNIGFLIRYCDYLNIDKNKYLRQYKEEKKVYDEINKKNIQPSKKGIISPGRPDTFKNKLRFVLTPQILTTTVIIFLVFGILGYIWFQVKSFAAPPHLDVNNPAEQIIVSEKKILISGKTDPVAELRINGRVAGIQENGNFSQNVELIEGINTIEIKAYNKANKETVKIIQVLVIDE